QPRVVVMASMTSAMPRGSRPLPKGTLTPSSLRRAERRRASLDRTDPSPKTRRNRWYTSMCSCSRSPPVRGSAIRVHLVVEDPTLRDANRVCAQCIRHILIDRGRDEHLLDGDDGIRQPFPARSVELSEDVVEHEHGVTRRGITAQLLDRGE